MIQKRLISFLILVFSLAAVPAQAGNWDPRAPLQYPSSFHALIQSDKTAQGDFLKENKVCLKAIRERLKKGGHFRSQTVIDNSLPIEEFPRADVKDNTFFHWTNATKALDQIAKQKSYADLFSYVRREFLDLANNLNSWTFYVAGDDESSDEYGDHAYQFSFYEGTRVYFQSGDLPGHLVDQSTLDRLILNELSERDPQLQKCAAGDGRGLTIIRALALEASNVSLIAYFGLDNTGTGQTINAQWLQVLNPWAMKSMTRYK